MHHLKDVDMVAPPLSPSPALTNLSSSNSEAAGGHVTLEAAADLQQCEETSQEGPSPTSFLSRTRTFQDVSLS